MKTRKKDILYGLIGASSGFASLVPLARCSGSCTACYGCAGIGVAIILVLIGQKIGGGKEGSDGMV